jgi:hypothetical protein
MWLFVMRPKAETTDSAATPAAPAATAPGAAGLGTAVDKANGAVTASEQSAAATEAATGEPATTKPGAATSGPAAANAPANPVSSATVDPSQPLISALSDGKVVVILFKGAGADDEAAHRAVRAADGGRKSIVSRIVDIKDVGDYEGITTGVQVNLAPTVLVIGPGKVARAITGFTDSAEIRQAVGDLRRK